LRRRPERSANAHSDRNNLPYCFTALCLSGISSTFS
jgi:hypothetical protein